MGGGWIDLGWNWNGVRLWEGLGGGLGGMRLGGVGYLSLGLMEHELSHATHQNVSDGGGDDSGGDGGDGDSLDRGDTFV